MGNQQERLEADRLWFGGVFDGEGNISLVLARPRKARKSNARSHVISPQIRFTNSDENVIEEVEKVLAEDNVAYHVANNGQVSKIGKRDIWHISINGMKRARRFLEAFAPYLRGKAKEANLVMDFIDSRMSRERGAPYIPKEIQCFIELAKIHGWRLPESPESIRQTLLSERR